MENKRRRVFFDKDYTVSDWATSNQVGNNERNIIRIEGVVISETDKESKIRTCNWIGNQYGVHRSPNDKKSGELNPPPIDKFYWISNDKLKDMK